ncbi:MAG: hypothetical protein WCV90_02070 [Candidatus Woesearchaeota archaeon]|jgi:hypothetical protein
MNKYFFIFLLLIPFVLAEDLSLQISTDKTQYSVGEEVLITVSLVPTNSISFFDTSVYLSASDKGDYLSFNEAKTQILEEGVYSTLSKSERSASYISEQGIFYGWWMFGTSPANPITLTGPKILAKFNPKVIASAATATEVELTFASRSKIITYGAGFTPENLPLKLNSAKITILPSGNITVTEVVPPVVTAPPPSSGSCTESWTCSEWSECVDGQKLRVCKDQRNCKTTFNKPVDKQVCTEEIPIIPVVKTTAVTPKKPSDLPKTTTTTTSSSFPWMWIIIGAVILIALIVTIILVALRTKPQPVDDHFTNSFRSWIEQQHQRNISDEQSKQLLLQQGWQASQVEDAFNRINNS